MTDSDCTVRAELQDLNTVARAPLIELMPTLLTPHHSGGGRDCLTLLCVFTALEHSIGILVHEVQQCMYMLA